MRHATQMGTVALVSPSRETVTSVKKLESAFRLCLMMLFDDENLFEAEKLGLLLPRVKKLASRVRDLQARGSRLESKMATRGV